MKENYLKSLRMIKILKIKNETEYNKLLKDYLILSSESLKYISQTRDFRKIIKLAITQKLPKCWWLINEIKQFEHFQAFTQFQQEEPF